MAIFFSISEISIMKIRDTSDFPDKLKSRTPLFAASPEI